MLESRRLWFVGSILFVLVGVVLVVSSMRAIWSLFASRHGVSEELGMSLLIMEGSEMETHLLSKERIKVGSGQSKVPATFA